MRLAPPCTTGAQGQCFDDFAAVCLDRQFQFIEQRMREGMPLAQAVVDAGAVRFRPMLLTAMAVVVRLLRAKLFSQIDE